MSLAKAPWCKVI